MQAPEATPEEAMQKQKTYSWINEDMLSFATSVEFWEYKSSLSIRSNDICVDTTGAFLSGINGIILCAFSE